MSMKNSNDTIGDGTRDLPACSAVPQPTAPSRAPHLTQLLENNFRPIICNYLGYTTNMKRSKISLGCSKFYKIKTCTEQRC